MAANWELQLITSIVRAEDPSAAYLVAVNGGITNEVFGNPEAHAIWSQITKHYNRPHNYGRVPSEQRLQETFDNSLRLPEASEDLQDITSLIIQKNQRRKIARATEDFLGGSIGEHEEGLAGLVASINAVYEVTQTKTDVSFSEVALSETAEEMETLASNQGITGIPWPWDRMNQITGGINAGDYIFIYAIPKSMKTWLGLVIAVAVAMTGRKVLVYSREMTWQVLRRRIGCILARASYEKFKKNQLTDTQKAEVLEAIRWFSEDCTGDIQFTDGDRSDGSAGGPDDIRRKIEVYQPQFVLLDSAYMLELPGQANNMYDWRMMSAVNRQCKQTCKRTGIPTIAIFQENERAAHKFKGTRGTASMAMNTNAIMDCDLAIRVVYDPEREQMSLHLPAARESREKGFVIHAKAAEDFTYANDDLFDLDSVGHVDEEEAGHPREAQLAQSIGTMRADYKESTAGE